jgi:hypothetical protein
MFNFGSVTKEKNVNVCCHFKMKNHLHFVSSRVSVTFINRDGVPLSVKAKVGDTLLDAAVNNDVDLEGFG